MVDTHLKGERGLGEGKGKEKHLNGLWDISEGRKGFRRKKGEYEGF